MKSSSDSDGSCPCVAMYYRITSSLHYRCSLQSILWPTNASPKIADAGARTPSATCSWSSLEILHHFTHRQIGRHRHKQMDMVFAHMSFHYLNVIRPTDLSHQFAHPRPYRPTQHRPAVFRDPHQVILQIVFRVTRRPVYLHTDVLPKGEGFSPIPRRRH